MPSNRRVLRPGRAAASVLLLVAVLVTAALPAGARTTQPQPTATGLASQTATGNYSGDAHSSLVDLRVLGGLLPTGALGEVALVPSSATVDSTATPRSAADAKNALVSVLGFSVPLQEAKQTAPPDNPLAVVNDFLPINLSPLLTADAINATANARWLGDNACPAIGTPLSHSTARVATASVLPGIIPGSPSLLTLNNGTGGLISSENTVALVSQSGTTNRAVQSTSQTQLGGLGLLGLTLNVLAAPKLVATAGGVPGSAKVAWTAPVIQVLQNGTPIATLDAANMSFALPSNPLVTLSLGSATNVVQAADGTHASADGSLLTIAVGLPVLGQVASLQILPVHAEATAPTGGVNCGDGNGGSNPLSELHKDVSAAQVAPGGTFTYTVTVPNRGSAPISNLVVTDTITGPAGFQIIGTAPPGTVSGNRVTWNDPTPLAPNETRNYTITVQVPTTAPNGSKFDDTATASGIYNGAPVTNTTTLLGMPTVAAPTAAGCSLARSNKAADHKSVTPGETFNYYVHVLNDGNQPCTSVSVSDTLNAKVTFVSCTNGCTHSGQNVTWNVGTVAPGSSLTLTVTVQVVAGATGTIPNTALIHQPGKADIPLNDPGPTIGTTSVLNPPNPPSFGGGGGKGPGAAPLAVTGWDTPWLLLVVLAAAAFGGATVLARSREVG